MTLNTEKILNNFVGTGATAASAMLTVNKLALTALEHIQQEAAAKALLAGLVSWVECMGVEKFPQFAGMNIKPLSEARKFLDTGELPASHVEKYGKQVELVKRKLL